MPTNKTTVTLPDGRVATRSSKTRVYTHAVVVGPRDPAKAAAYLRAQADEYDRMADATERALVEPKIVRIDRGVGRNGGDPDVDYRGERVYYGFEYHLVGSVEAVYPNVGRVRINERGDSQGMTDAYGSYETGEYVSYGDKGSDKRVVPVKEHLLAHARADVNAKRARAAHLRAKADQVLAEGTEGDGYTVARWSSRADLAEKAIGSEFAQRVAAGHRVYVQPVDPS